MLKCIAVYPEQSWEQSKEKLREYLKLAKKMGINEVFTSIHLPELSLPEQIGFLNEVAICAKDLKLDLIADIGGGFIKEALSDGKIMNQLRSFEIAYLRLDYGYSFEQLKMLYEKLNLRGFVINASMFHEAEIENHLRFFYKLDPNISIRACHNFYVREESGLDKDFALKQSSYFEKRNIPVYYCVPSYDHPRGPLHLGLPTIEAHRHQPVESVLLDLCCTYHAEAVLLADEWMSEKTLQKMNDFLLNKEVEIPVVFEKSATEKERNIVLGNHTFRYDSNASFLRSRSSREMAEFASVISGNNCIKRRIGDITVDNENYLRYSGEMQVVLRDFKADSRVNVIAHLKNREDINKLSYYRDGIVYRFIEATDENTLL